VLFRRALGIRGGAFRIAAAAAALATVPVGLYGTAVAQLAVLLAVFLAAFTVESVRRRPAADRVGSRAA
jgi:hypothetical protein